MPKETPQGRGGCRGSGGAVGDQRGLPGVSGMSGARRGCRGSGEVAVGGRGDCQGSGGSIRGHAGLSGVRGSCRGSGGAVGGQGALSGVRVGCRGSGGIVGGQSGLKGAVGGCRGPGGAVPARFPAGVPGLPRPRWRCRPARPQRRIATDKCGLAAAESPKNLPLAPKGGCGVPGEDRGIQDGLRRVTARFLAGEKGTPKLG